MSQDPLSYPNGTAMIKKTVTTQCSDCVFNGSKMKKNNSKMTSSL